MWGPPLTPTFAQEGLGHYSHNPTLSELWGPTLTPSIAKVQKGYASLDGPVYKPNPYLDQRHFERRRRPINLIAIAINVFFPWFVFSTSYTALCYKLHYDSPELAWLVVFAGCCACLVSAVLALRTKRRDLDATWYSYSAVACCIAVSLAVIFGSLNYLYYTKPVFVVETMNTYPAVNAAQAKGSQLMDAGRVFFTPDTGIDNRRAMGFKSSELFCVAPIVTGTGELASYDFWAVGTNCCSGVSSDFRCGDYSNPHAHAGLRLARDDQRPFFRLAVQQAEAAYGIKATHPIFFYWTQDPYADTGVYRDTGLKYYMIGVFGHFGLNFLCVALVTTLVSQGWL